VTPTLTVVPLPGLPEVRPGDDLARLLIDALTRAGCELADGDVLAVTSKVVAKAEGRLVPLPADEAGRAAVRAAAVAGETVRVLARRGELVIAETRTGVVGANALVDASNAGGDRLVLPPLDPDASAERLRARLHAETGRRLAVVVTDTLGRPWRLGQTDAAIGLAGMAALADQRGRPDDDGRTLEVTETAVPDEVAAAADLVKGKTGRVAAALLRGVPWPSGPAGSARDLVRPAADDLFRVAAGPPGLLALLEPSGGTRRFAPDPVDPAAVERAVRTTAAAPLPHRAPVLRVVEVSSVGGRRARYLEALEQAGEEVDRLTAAPVLLVPCLAPGGPPRYRDARRRDAEQAAALLAVGGALGALLLALHAEGLGATWSASSLFCQDAAAAALDLPAGWRPLGSVAAGHPGTEPTPRPWPPLAPGDPLLRR